MRCARRFLLVLCASLLSACGGGGGRPGFDNTPVGAGGTGTLAVVINNLPAGMPAAVRVTGPGNFALNLTASQTIANLAPGAYTVAAGSVAAGATSYVPFPATQSVTIASGASATATVGYAAGSTGAAPGPVLTWLRIGRAAPTS